MSRVTNGSMNPPPLQAIVFDMDGLMVDTEPLSRIVWQAILADYEQTLTDETYAQMVGRRADESVRLVLENHDLPLTAAELTAIKTERWGACWRQGVPVRPGLHELHEEISRRNIPWAVATSSGRDYALEILAQLGLQPTKGAVAGGDEVTHSKPAPDIYLLAAERLGVPPAQCLALEDSVPGGMAAVAAGMTLAAVPYDSTSPADFPFATGIYASLHQVLQELDRFFPAGHS